MTNSDHPDGTYVELVASLFGTRLPATIMTIMFLAVGALTVRASQDRLLADLVVVGAMLSIVRLAVLMRGRWHCDHSQLSLLVAQRFERLFALTYVAFATAFGLFAARAFALPLAEWRMPVGILVVGYAAGAASTIAMRPRIVVASLVLSVIPPSGVLLFRHDTSALVSALCLLALFAGALRSVSQRYYSQSTTATTRHAFALQARTDPLTGLGNRLALAQTFEAHTNPHDRERLAFHYVDLDDFKPVNDQYGHQVGDLLLCLVAERLKGCRNSGDEVVRLGGDEFVFVQIHAENDIDVERQAARIESALNSPYTVDGRPVVVGASVGSSPHRGSGQGMEALLVAADDALRQRKAARKSRPDRVLASNDDPVPIVRIGPVAAPANATADAGRNIDELREHEARAQLLIDGIAKAMWESAPDGLIETDSPSWRAYTGQSYDDWKGYGWLTAVHPDDRLATMEKWRHTVHDQRAVDAEYRLRGHDGRYRWMGVHAVPMRNENGQILKWFGINIDIDDRKQSERDQLERKPSEQARDSHRSTNLLLSNDDTLSAAF